MITRRDLLKIGALAGAGMMLPTRWVTRGAQAQAIPGGTLLPGDVPKYAMPLIKPPAMPGKFKEKNKNKNMYKIAVRQFPQHILPPGMGLQPTTVWSYGSKSFPGPAVDPATGQLTGGSFNYPAFTIEAEWNKDTQVLWINDLIDPMTKNYLPHILPVDQTLHWANPPGGIAGRDMHGSDHAPYMGPVPIVTHVHGAHTLEDSDGYPEAWYLPAANNIPAGYAHKGTYFDIFNDKYRHNWVPGAVSFKYPNTQRATTLWYHDHTLGMTRVNVYAGPAGFYLIRGGPDDVTLDAGNNNAPAVLPGPAPGVGDDPFGAYYEIPIVIQDRSFNADGSLFYPDNRAFFESLNAFGITPEQFPGEPYLNIPFWDDPACPMPGTNGLSDIPPIWLPEFFGNMMVVNGFTWPYLQVEPQLYRLRLLNGCNSRFLILKFDHPGVQVWQIGADGGFLPGPLDITNGNDNMLLMGPAERADVIVDFRALSPGDRFELLNLGPDEPFGGGVPDVDFPAADPASTGKVMQFEVVSPGLISAGLSAFTEPGNLVLPAIPAINPGAPIRPLSLNEEGSKTVYVSTDADGNVVLDCVGGGPFGPSAALLGTYNPTSGLPTPMLWSEPITENPALGTTETWEIYNFTADAHPIHIHLVQFQIVNRQALAPVGTNSFAPLRLRRQQHRARTLVSLEADGVATLSAFADGTPRPPEAGETGFKDTVIAYPGEVTRVQARFDIIGQYVWHCHIIEHEDNEMMRPYQVV